MKVGWIVHCVLPLQRNMLPPKYRNLSEEDYYTTAEGYIVFTETYHLKRGYCCQSGCKHCPYGFDKATGRFIKKKKEG